MSAQEGEGERGARPAGERERRHSRSLERGLALIGCFTPERPVLGTSELARMLGMSRATAYRYVRALERQGYLERAQTGGHRLSLGALELGMTTLGATGLCLHARPELEALARHGGYEVALAVLDGGQALVLDRVQSARREQRELGADADIRAGLRLPAYCTSLGKALLAQLPAAQRRQVISEMTLRPYTAKTIVSAQALDERLQEARARGLAVSQEERLPGVCAIAAPVREESGEVVAAVSVTVYGHELDLRELIERLGDPLQRTARGISARLGWAGADAG